MEHKKEIVIKAPEGKHIDMELFNATGKIEFIDDEKELPQSWEELKSVSGYWIRNTSGIEDNGSTYFAGSVNKNIIPTKELAEAVLALCQLLQLRDRYNDGWVPDWRDHCHKHSILVVEDKIIKYITVYYQWILTFKTKELRDKFFEAPEIYKLIEIAKPLL